MVEHHLVVLAPDAGLFVTAEGRMGGVEVVAIGPDPSGLEPAAEAVGPVDIPGPDAGTKPIKRVVGDGHGLVVIVEGNPLDPATMIGAQASNDQLEKILSYIEIGKKEGAKVLTGGARRVHAGELEQGYYVQPTVFEGQNRMRIFQEEIFGPVLAVTRFKDMSDALSIANDTLYGLGAGVWSRDVNTCYRMGRGIKAGRVWTNCYHAYPAHAAFGGYKQSGIGRENHRMMLDHYQQTKNMLVSYSPKKLGFF